MESLLNKNLANKCLVYNFDKNSDVSLYIHIPFCRGKCAYCGFYSEPILKTEESLREQYFKRLLDEIKIAKDYFEKPFKTVYIGGGTPLLKENIKYIAEILQAVYSPLTEEITIEANAFNIDEETAHVIKPYISRLSVGVQSFDKAALTNMGRFYTSIEECGEILKTFSDKEVNFDFILTPFENDITETTFRPFFKYLDTRNIKRPEHISLYLLTLEEGTPLFKKLKNTLLDDDSESEKLQKAWKYLKGEGYVHYEVSQFARLKNNSGDNGSDNRGLYSSLHNLRYWNLENYLGLGATAASHSRNGFDFKGPLSYIEYAKGEPFENSPNLGYEMETLTKEDIAVELLLTHLRTIYGINREKFDSLTGFSLDNTVRKASLRSDKAHNVSDYYKNGTLALSEDELLFSDFYINLLTVCLTP